MAIFYVERPNEIRISYGEGKRTILSWGYFRTKRFFEGLQSGREKSRRVVSYDKPAGEEINEVYINDVLVFKEGKMFY